MSAGNAGAWDDEARGYGPDGGYPVGGPQGYEPHGYGTQGYAPQGDGYDDGYGQQTQGGYDGQYGQQPQGGYDGQYGQQPQGGYDGPLSYPDEGYGYGQPTGYQQQPSQGYGTGGYQAAPTGYQSGGYPASPASSYPAPGGGGSGAYPVSDAGNDWYGGQPNAASGASFADTGTYSLNGRVIDEYGTGPRPMPGPARGQQPGTRSAAGRLALPAAESKSPAVSETRQQPVAQTRQQQRLDPSAPGQGRNPSGAYPTRNPSGAYPTSNSSGAYPTRNPSGAYPTSNSSGAYPTRNPSGAYPTRNPSGAYPTTGAKEIQKAGSGAYPTVGGRNEFGSSGGGMEDSGPSDAFEGNRNPRARPAIESRKNRGGGKRMLLAALAVVVVGIIAAAAYVFVLKPKPANSNQSITAGSAAVPSMAQTAQANQACSAAIVKTLGEFCHIETAADDPKPLTVAELYPAAFSNTSDKMSYSLVADKIDTTCANAVIDANTSNPVLANALKAAHCTQVVRGSYVTTGEKITSNADIMGTIAVINLGTTNEAHAAGKDVGNNDFIAPLTSNSGVAAKLGNGTGLIEADFKGHYLIVTWAQYVNGTAPTTAAQDVPLKQFSEDLLNETANNALDTRMVTGVPNTAAA